MTASDDHRRPFDISRESNRLPVGPGPKEVSSFDPRFLDFGHYAGQSIEELAKTDPEYVEWLAQHPSGARFRGEIARVRTALGRTSRLWPQLG
jgi:broad specificity phosphatase PhoE